MCPAFTGINNYSSRYYNNQIWLHNRMRLLSAVLGTCNVLHYEDPFRSGPPYHRRICQSIQKISGDGISEWLPEMGGLWD